MSLLEEFKRTFKKHSTRPAINFRNNWTSFPELDIRSNQVSNGLKTLGVEKGGRVGLFLPNSIDFIISYLGILKIGAITVPLNVMYKSREIKHILGDSGAKVLITSQDKLSLVEAVLPHLPELREIVVTGSGTARGISFERFSHASAMEPREKVEAEDLALICYTSGTTGHPKGAMLTHNNLASNIRTLVDSWTNYNDMRHFDAAYHCSWSRNRPFRLEQGDTCSCQPVPPRTRHKHQE